MSAPVKMEVPSWLSVVVGSGAPSRAPRAGSCLTPGKEFSKETLADKARDFIGRRQLGKGIQNCSATWLAVSGFILIRLVSGLSLANHSGSESFLVVQASLNQDGC